MTKRLIMISLVLLLLSPLGAAHVLRAQGKTPGVKDSSPPVIGNIRNDRIADGCGCYFGHPQETRKRVPRFVFFSDLNDKNAWMNIDGKDVKLRLVGSTNPKVERVGSRLTRTYAAAGIKVFVVYITTEMCKPGDESCEVVEYDATFTVNRNGQKRTIKLKGGCGC